MKTKFSEIKIGQQFHQLDKKGEPMVDSLFEKTKNASHNQAGRAVMVRCDYFEQHVGRKFTVPQNRNCKVI